MKKAKNITIGAKVFAKVKGYPAWPAKVAEDLGGGKKFKVIFYGTGETGIVKPEDIFSYGDHKDQFVKNLKRKDYNEAVEEIEAAIAAEASGTTLPKQEEVEISDVELDDEPPVSRGQKRKLSVDSSSGSEVKKKAPSKTESRRSSHTPSASSKVAQDTLDQDRADEEEEDEPDEPEDELEDEDEDEENEEEEDEDEEEEEASGNNNRKSKAGNEESSEEDPDEVEEVKEPTKFVIIPPYDLQELIDDFEDSKTETRVNTDKPEPGMMAQNEILLARLNPDQYIGIKLNQNPPQKFDTESDQLRWKADDYRRALELKDKIESGAMKPEDNPDLFELELELTEEQRQEAIKTRIMERKRMKLKYLRVEANMVELDANIKQYLSVEKADPIAAIKELDLMMALNLTKLMVKKHSHVMEMVKRLRRYVGNVKSWNFSDEELVEFNKNSEIIRNKAEILYNKLQSLFSVPDDSTFAEVYVSELEKFKSQTKAMTESQVFLLCAEPGSKEAILDNDIEQEEIELVAAKNQKKEKKKQPIES